MKLVLEQRKTGRKRRDRLQQRFERLRSKLEKKRADHERLTRDLDELVGIYQRGSIDNDRAMFDDLATLAEKLIDFAGRKSLSQWHRVELNDWLEDLIERRLAGIGPETAERLRAGYREVLATSMGLSVTQFVELIETQEVDSGREFEEQPYAEGIDDDDEPWQDDLFGFEGAGFDEADAQFDGATHGSGRAAGHPDEHAGRKFIDGTWAKALFRRAAQTLHPDREPDAERREIKQKAMRELLAAREDGDIMTMLTLYGEHVSGADVAIAEQEMNELCETLEEAIADLDAKNLQFIYSDPVRHLVFELFYTQSGKGRAARLREWERELARERAEVRDLIGRLRNLTSLKAVLAERRDERSAMFADLMFDEGFY